MCIQMQGIILFLYDHPVNRLIYLQCHSEKAQMIKVPSDLRCFDYFRTGVHSLSSLRYSFIMPKQIPHTHSQIFGVSIIYFIIFSGLTTFLKHQLTISCSSFVVWAYVLCWLLLYFFLLACFGRKRHIYSFIKDFLLRVSFNYVAFFRESIPFSVTFMPTMLLFSGNLCLSQSKM